jgi:hypothetical protein
MGTRLEFTEGVLREVLILAEAMKSKRPLHQDGRGRRNRAFENKSGAPYLSFSGALSRGPASL